MEQPQPLSEFLRYVPQPQQLEFHAGAGIWFLRGLSCGTGAGKTLCGLAEDIRWALKYPGSVGYIFEPSYPMVRRILLPTLESPLLLGSPVEANPNVKEYNKAEARLDWRNGSRWYFVSLEDPERAEGPNVDYAHIDEARLVRHFDLAWLTIIRRLRGSGRCQTPLTPAVWITTTPDSPGSDLYNVLENPETRGRNVKLLRWSIYDNAKLPKSFIDEIVRTHTGGLADRFIYGRFAAVAGGSLPFDSSLHVRTADRGHLQFVRYGVDFGWTNPTAILAVGFDGDARAWVLEEVYERHMTAEDIVRRLLEMSARAKYGPGQIMCDASEPETIAKMRLANLDARPYTFKRDDGLREMGGRFAKAGDGRPRLFVSPACVNLISELLEYRDDVKERDHAVDALRYALPLAEPTGPVQVRRGLVK